MTSQSLQIVVADDIPEMRILLQKMLQRLGHRAILVENGRQLVETCLATDPDLILADVKMPGMDGIEAAEELRHRPVPIILISGYHDPELLSRVGTGNIMAYLVKPVEDADVQAAIAVAMTRFRIYREAEQEATRLRQTLEERKIIERAKGILMKRLQLDEPEAFRRMRKFASDRNATMVQIAQEVISAEDLFQMLERR